MWSDGQILEAVKSGRSFLNIVQEMDDDASIGSEQRKDINLELLKRVASVAGYEPVFPRWMVNPSVVAYDRMVRVAYRRAFPTIVLLDNVLDEWECDKIIELSKPKLTASMVHDSGEFEGTGIHSDRKSESVYLERGATEFIKRIDARCASIMHSPVENGESLQVVRYTEGGEYKPHYDYFRSNQLEDSNRIATLIMYLNDVEEGGETFFPGCGVNITPKKGSGLYFSYADQQGRLDPQTLHGGKPVLKGEKWIVTKWARRSAYTLPV